MTLNGHKSPGPGKFHSRIHSPEHEDVQGELWTIHMDGSSTQKKGGASVVIASPEGDILKYEVQLKFPVINNEVEYEAILTGLKMLC